MIAAQGGDLAGLPTSTGETAVAAPTSGYVQAIDGREVGLVAVQLGAGRATRDDVLDLVVGIRIDAKVGAFVSAGAPIATILHGARGAPDAHSIARLTAAFTLGPDAPAPRPLVLQRIG